MTLHVDFEHFADAAKEHLANPQAYLSRHENRIQATAADPKASVVVSASTKLTFEEAKAALVKAGMVVLHGAWSEASGQSEDSLGELPFVAAVAYKSGDEMPGLWMDAYESAPTPAVVLKSIFDEFKQTGEVGEMTFEEFIRMAAPNVAIIGPTDIERYLNDKSGCE